MDITSILASAAFLLSQQQVAQETAPQAADSQDKNPIVVTGEKPTRDKKVCKRETTTGSIMPKNTCRTVAEWDEMTQQSLVAKEKWDQERRARDLVQLLREQSK